MFEITIGANDEVILSGRFDATQVEKARAFFLPLSQGKVVDCKARESISSAGLGILLATQKRLSRKQHRWTYPRCLSLCRHRADLPDRMSRRTHISTGRLNS